MRRYDIAAILGDRARFKQILTDHLKGGQAKARADLDRIEREIAKARQQVDLTDEVAALRERFEAERARVMEARNAQTNIKESVAEDEAYLDALRQADAETPEGRAALDAERQDVETRIADEKAAQKRADDGSDDPVMADGTPISEVKRIVERGETYRVPDDVIESELIAASDFLDAIPAGSRLGVWASVGPSPLGPHAVSMTFQTFTGKIAIHGLLDAALRSRAMYVPDFDLIVVNKIGADGTAGAQATGVYQEIVHASWRRFDDATGARLVGHAEALRVMDMELGTFLRAIDDPTWKHAPAGETLRMCYASMYGNRADMTSMRPGRDGPGDVL